MPPFSGQSQDSHATQNTFQPLSANRYQLLLSSALPAAYLQCYFPSLPLQRLKKPQQTFLVKTRKDNSFVFMTLVFRLSSTI